MESLQKKSVKTSRGFTYTYYVSDPAAASKDSPPLFLMHGFPDEAHMWDAVVSKLPGYRVIVPDMLGYAGTSKPTDPAAYQYGPFATDLTEILDAENVDKVVAVGHDWGSAVAQRFYNYHSERVSALVLLNVAYMLPPADPVDLAATNAFLEKVFGRPLLAYQELMISDEGPALLKAHADRLYDGVHAAPRDFFGEILCTTGTLKKWLLNESNDWNVEVREFAKDPEMKRRFVERFQRDGFEAPVCYYKANSGNIQQPHDKLIPRENLVVNVPMLYFGCLQDAVCRPEMMAPAQQGGFLPDLEIITLDCSHWSPLEAPDAIASGIDNFLAKKISK